MNFDEKCALCDKTISNLLTHLRFTHNIKGTDQYALELSMHEKRKDKRVTFAKYVEELQKKEKNGEITAEKYRELITEWNKQNK